MDEQSILFLIRDAGFEVNKEREQVCNYFSISTRTYYHWFKNPPELFKKHLRLRAGYIEGWPQWRFLKGKLIAPDGLKFSPADFLALPYYRSIARDLENRLAVWDTAFAVPRPSNVIKWDTIEDCFLKKQGM